MGIVSSRVIIAAFFGVAMIGSTVFLLTRENVRKELVAPFQAAFASGNDWNDTDEDGLSDWEEKLFGTNSRNPDSDGDGVLDGPQWHTEKEIPELEPTDSPLNYLNSVAESMPSIPEAKLEIPQDKYSTGDLTIIPTEIKNVLGYIAGLVLAMKTPEGIEDPLDTVNRWLESNDERDLALIAEAAQRESEREVKIGALSVPEALVSLHLMILNSTYQAALALDEIKVAVHNPQAGFFAAAKYANFKSKRSAAIVELTGAVNTALSKEQKGSE